jgi:hypothetical protein
MEKIALGNIGASAATLGTIGALGGGVMNYMKARREGQTRKDALLSAGKGAVVGGGAGALGGAGIAAGSRALRGWNVNPVTYGDKAHGLLSRLDKSIGDFGRRQVHAVSGYLPQEARGLNNQERAKYLKGIGIGGYQPAQDAVQAATDHLKAVQAGGGKGLIPMPQKIREGLAHWDKFQAEQAAKAQDAFMQHGATSLPGFVGAMARPEARGEVLKGVGRDLAFGWGALGTYMLGTGVYDTYKGVRGDVLPGQENMGRGERIGNSLGNAAGWALPSTIPVLGNQIGGTVLSKAFGGVGRAVDKVTGSRPPTVARAPLTDPTDPVASTANQLGGVQHTMSASAAGKPYGGGMEQ